MKLTYTRAELQVSTEDLTHIREATTNNMNATKGVTLVYRNNPIEKNEQGLSTTTAAVLYSLEHLYN